jgi:N-methylhydantoinase A
MPHAKLNEEFAALEKAAVRDFLSEHWNGTPRFVRTIDLRYRGQGYELNLPLTKNLLHEFEQEHRRRYGYTHAKREIEVVTLRLRAVLTSSQSHATEHAGSATRGKIGRKTANEAEVFFEGHKVKAAIYPREELNTRKTFRGPAVVTEYSATTVVSPGKKFRIDAAGNLIIAV